MFLSALLIISKNLLTGEEVEGQHRHHAILSSIIKEQTFDIHNSQMDIQGINKKWAKPESINTVGSVN